MHLHGNKKFVSFENDETFHVIDMTNRTLTYAL